MKVRAGLYNSLINSICAWKLIVSMLPKSRYVVPRPNVWRVRSNGVIAETTRLHFDMPRGGGGWDP